MTEKIEQVDQGIEQQTDAGQESGKLFTQEEVSRIVTERLKRAKTTTEKDHEQAIADLRAEYEAKETELTKREKTLSCREYLMENDYPITLLDIIETDDIDKFKEKANLIRNEFAKARQVPPLKSTESHNGFDDLKKAFADPQHKPKQF